MFDSGDMSSLANPEAVDESESPLRVLYPSDSKSDEMVVKAKATPK